MVGSSNSKAFSGFGQLELESFVRRLGRQLELESFVGWSIKLGSKLDLGRGDGKRKCFVDNCGNRTFLFPLALQQLKARGMALKKI